MFRLPTISAPRHTHHPSIMTPTPPLRHRHTHHPSVTDTHTTPPSGRKPHLLHATGIVQPKVGHDAACFQHRPWALGEVDAAQETVQWSMQPSVFGNSSAVATMIILCQLISSCYNDKCLILCQIISRRYNDNSLSNHQQSLQ